MESDVEEVGDAPRQEKRTRAEFAPGCVIDLTTGDELEAVDLSPAPRRGGGGGDILQRALDAFGIQSRDEHPAKKARTSHYFAGHPAPDDGPPPRAADALKRTLDSLGVPPRDERPAKKARVPRYFDEHPAPHGPPPPPPPGGIRHPPPQPTDARHRYFQIHDDARRRREEERAASERAEAADREGLAPEQLAMLQIAEHKQSFFYTGGPGTGKSHVLRRRVSAARRMYAAEARAEAERARIASRRRGGRWAAGGGDDPPPPGDGVYVTASTGAAGCNIDGTTLHRYLGLGLVGDGTDGASSGGHASVAAVGAALDKLRKPWMAATRQRIAGTNMLVVDECSMITTELFEILDAVARAARGESRLPFGGMQLVLCGDFYQLPPVRRGSTSRDAQSLLLFETAAFSAAFGDRVYTLPLRENFRQCGDAAFCDVLADVRAGLVKSGRVLAFIRAHRVGRVAVSPAAGGPPQMREVEPLRQFVALRSTRAAADAGNATRNAELRGPARFYAASDWNASRGGSRRAGAAGACGDAAQPASPADDGSWIAPSSIELKVGSRVMLLANLDVDAGLYNGTVGDVVGFSDDKPAMPIVAFEMRDGTTARRAVAMHTWEQFLGSTVVASRSALPLRLTWFMSYHKMQGATVDGIEISVDGLFERGLFYVGLSRSRSAENVRIRGGESLDSLLDPSRPIPWVFLPDPRVVAFDARTTSPLAPSQPADAAPPAPDAPCPHSR